MVDMNRKLIYAHGMEKYKRPTPQQKSNKANAPLVLMILSWSLAILSLMGLLRLFGLSLDNFWYYLMASVSAFFGLFSLLFKKNPYKLAALFALIFSGGLILYFATGINAWDWIPKKGK